MSRSIARQSAAKPGPRRKKNAAASPVEGPTCADTTTWGNTAGLIGSSRLVMDAVTGATDITEAMHRNIAGLAPLVGPSRSGPTTGVTGLVYRNVRRVSALVGESVEASLRQLAPLLDARTVTYQPEALLAALNGVLGDHLVASGNPLAIPSELRFEGASLTLEREALKLAIPQPSNRLIVLLHGLCMSDGQWRRNDHDHGAALAQEFGHTPLYLRYNSGLPVWDSGRSFADLLEVLVSQWPVPVHELVIVGHSMGGLVARSACLWAREAGQHWPERLGKMIFLGTPHHGSALERLGCSLESLLEVSPYIAPIGRLGKIRSAGIRDLGEGNVRMADREVPATEPTHPLEAFPPGTRCYAIAATTRAHAVASAVLERGDGLVPLSSALGQHTDETRSLPIPASRQAVFHGLNHFDLLDNQQVYERMVEWLAEA